MATRQISILPQGTSAALSNQHESYQSQEIDESEESVQYEENVSKFAHY